MLPNTPTEPGLYWAKVESSNLPSKGKYNVLVNFWGTYPGFTYTIYDARDLNIISGNKHSWTVWLSNVVVWGPKFEAPNEE